MWRIHFPGIIIPPAILLFNSFWISPISSAFITSIYYMHVPLHTCMFLFLKCVCTRLFFSRIVLIDRICNICGLLFLYNHLLPSLSCLLSIVFCVFSSLPLSLPLFLLLSVMISIFIVIFFLLIKCVLLCVFFFFFLLCGIEQGCWLLPLWIPSLLISWKNCLGELIRSWYLNSFIWLIGWIGGGGEG